MKKIFIACSLSFLLFNSAAAADDKSLKAAEELFAAMDMQQVMDQSVESVVNVQLQQKPELLPYKEVMLTFFRKYMSYESLKPELAALYAETFTVAEIKDITAFYKTRTGKKMLTSMPVLMGKGAQIGINGVQEHLEEFQEMMRAEIEKNEHPEPGK